jgi:hypothetical protein
VVLDVRRGTTLEVREKHDRALAKNIIGMLPEEASRELSDRGQLVGDRFWVWRPIGNEELGLLRVCAGIGWKPACGMVIFRAVLERVQILGWASSAHRFPMVKVDRDPRDLWMISGDDSGTIQKRIAYVWGTVSIGGDERRLPKKKRKKSSRN